MWNLKYDANELIYKTETASHREQTCGCQGGGEEGGGGRTDWYVGTNKCKLLYVCVTESLCCTPETNTTL